MFFHWVSLQKKPMWAQREHVNSTQKARDTLPNYHQTPSRDWAQDILAAKPGLCQWFLWLPLGSGGAGLKGMYSLAPMASAKAFLFVSTSLLSLVYQICLSTSICNLNFPHHLSLLSFHYTSFLCLSLLIFYLHSTGHNLALTHIFTPSF